MQFGCMTLPATGWADKHDLYARQYEPADAAAYAALTRAWVQLAKQVLGGGA